MHVDYTYCSKTLLINVIYGIVSFVSSHLNSTLDRICDPVYDELPPSTHNSVIYLRFKI
jgi:hypothetical protein